MCGGNEANEVIVAVHGVKIRGVLWEAAAATLIELLHRVPLRGITFETILESILKRLF